MWLALWDRDFRDFGTSETEREQKKTRVETLSKLAPLPWRQQLWLCVNGETTSAGGFNKWFYSLVRWKLLDEIRRQCCCLFFFRFFLVWYKLFLKIFHNLQLNVLWKILQSIWSTQQPLPFKLSIFAEPRSKLVEPIQKRPQHKPSFAASNCTQTHRYKFSTLIMLYQEATNSSCQHWHETSPASSFWHGKTTTNSPMNAEALLLNDGRTRASFASEKKKDCQSACILKRAKNSTQTNRDRSRWSLGWLR